LLTAVGSSRPSAPQLRHSAEQAFAAIQNELRTHRDITLRVL